MQAVEYWAKLAKIYGRHFKKFQILFGTPLSAFWDKKTGFDPVLFDDKIVKAPDGTSIYEAVEKKYGKEAHDLLETIILEEEDITEDHEEVQ